MEYQGPPRIDGNNNAQIPQQTPPMNPMGQPNFFPPYFMPRIPVMFNPANGTFMVGPPANNMFPPNPPTPPLPQTQPTQTGDPEKLKQIENFLFGILKKDTPPEPQQTVNPPIQPVSTPSTPVKIPQKGEEIIIPMSPLNLNPDEPKDLDDSFIKETEGTAHLKSDSPAKPTFQKYNLDGPSPSKGTGPPLWMQNTPGTFLENLSRQILHLHEFLEPDMDKFNQRREKLLKIIQKILDKTFPESSPKLHLFGSSANQFGMKDADVDLCLEINQEIAGNAKDIIFKLGSALFRKRMEDVQKLWKARVPILKFFEPNTFLQCDMCINNLLAIHNTRLLATYASIDSRLRSLGYAIKYWAKRRGINSPYHGTLSSYALIVMVVAFLQQRKPPILPTLQQLPVSDKKPDDVRVQGFDTYFFSDMAALKDFGKANTETLGELWVAFFKYYATQLQWNKDAISIRMGKSLVTRQDVWKMDLTPENLKRDADFAVLEPFELGLEDPFEVTHNLARGVDGNTVQIIKSEFVRAHQLLSKKKVLKEICKVYKEDENK